MIDWGLTTACSGRASRAADAERSEARGKGVCMEQVLGIGGVFFKARDFRALAASYPEHSGVPVEPEHTYGAFTSAAAGAQAAWSAFSADTSYFGSGRAPFMVNHRSRNLDTMLAQLRAYRARVDDLVEDYDYGRFGWATDVLITTIAYTI
jgi:hypothetical protein